MRVGAAVIAGPVVGGLLYEAGCWALPFAVGASALLVASLCLTLLLGRAAPPSLLPRGTELGSPFELLRIGDVWLVALPTLVLSMVAAFLEPTWQLYLGSPPFLLSPQRVGLFLQGATLMYLLVLVLSGFLLPAVGPPPQMALGCAACVGGMLLLGPSPLLHGALPTTLQPTIIAGAVLTFGGIGAAIPALTPMALEVCHAHGLSQRQVASASASLFASLVHIANVLGPLLGGALKATGGGFPLATTIYALVGGAVCAVCCARLLMLYLRRPDAGCLAKRRES